jgi:hypothetical protein
MTDHVARPQRAASFPRVDELRQLDRDAYQTAEARRREQNHRDDVHGLALPPAHNPLYDPEAHAPIVGVPLETAIARAREALAEKGQANLHDRDEMIGAAYGLHHALHVLLAALDAEGGGRR